MLDMGRQLENMIREEDRERERERIRETEGGEGGREHPTQMCVRQAKYQNRDMFISSNVCEGRL